MKMRQCFVILLSVCFLCGAFTGTASASKWGNIIGSVLGGGSSSGSSAEYQPVTVIGKIVDREQVVVYSYGCEWELSVERLW